MKRFKLLHFTSPQPLAVIVKTTNMSRLIILAIILTVVACNNKKKDSGSNQEKKENTNELQDTLRNPNHYYYFADINPKIFANWILNDSIQPSDNFSTFRVMDSLEAKTFEDREFYFKVFLKIKEKSDGALAEAIGLPALKYTENHTEELLKLTTNYPEEIFESWAYTVGLEIMLSSNENSIKEVNEFFNKLKNNCSTENHKKLEVFYNFMIDAINQNED
jgi:hypothetical protein